MDAHDYAEIIDRLLNSCEYLEPRLVAQSKVQIPKDNRYAFTPSTLGDIDRISSGHKDLEDAAREMRTASPSNMLEKAKNWIGLLASVEGLTEFGVQSAMVREDTHWYRPVVSIHKAL